MTSPIRKIATLSAALVAFAAAGSAATMGTAIFGTAPAAFAQDAQTQPSGGGHGGQRMGQILLSLGLSDAQKAKIKDIVGAARKQNEGVTDRTVKRQNMMKAYEQVETVLTPAQDKVFKEKRDEMRKQYQQQQGQQGGH